MERKNTQNRKRTRDHGGDDQKKESHKGKKPETLSSIEDSFYNDQKCYDVGVFDFPWLKEGLIFKVDEYLEPEAEKFAPCSYLDEFPGTSAVLNSYVSPALDGNFHGNKSDDDGFWSLQVDDVEQIDCIWSCAIDQPLDNIGFKKG